MSELLPAFVHDFFVQYAEALLARDAAGLAELYAVPALILFPGNSVPVSERTQAEEFFAASWEQYEGVESLTNEVHVVGEAPSSLWVDVAWSYDGQVRERFCYQLIEDAGEWRIAVLTPLAV
ncbi:DUF4440 domain-containing protein [Corynebacterium sp. A21]|uniref:DUF4440 domain-containing protein n=1 Tax=Corynebacterium sp. A21 TaxID=3457318 RepID=UPI003FD673E6